MNNQHSFTQSFYSMLLHSIGWTYDSQIPDFPKFLVIGAPHTSNWDFVYFIFFIKAIGIDIKFIGKDTLFKGPMGIILRKLGGIPVNRRSRNNFVNQMISLFNRSSKLIVVIAPEGTRQKTNYWKSGFYHIANGARIPILLAYINYPKKQIGFGPCFVPTGDIHIDFSIIQKFYADKIGKFPEKQGTIQLNPSI